MKKAFKYRIYANQQTLQKAEHWLDLCRDLYNAALWQRILIYRQDKKFTHRFTQIKQLPDLKTAFPEYMEGGADTLQDVIERLDKAYSAFFRRVKNGDKPGFPRFKGKGRYDSFTLKKSGWKLIENHLMIGKLGTFKLRLSRPIEGRVKTVTIRRMASAKWFVCFACDEVPTRPLPKTRNLIGIDVGCSSFLTTSSGQKVTNPRFYKKSQKILSKRLTRLRRRKNGSHRRQKARVLVAKACEKVANQRRDFHFKVANYFVRNNDTICIEKMNAWFNNYHNLNQSKADVAWFGFFDILRFKAVEAGREVVEVPARGTTTTCSKCGANIPKSLSERVHSCSHCGLVLDRDHNAALNILQLGLRQSLQVPCTGI